MFVLDRQVFIIFILQYIFFKKFIFHLKVLFVATLYSSIALIENITYGDLQNNYFTLFYGQAKFSY